MGISLCCCNDYAVNLYQNQRRALLFSKITGTFYLPYHLQYSSIHKIRLKSSPQVIKDFLSLPKTISQETNAKLDQL